MERNSGDNGTMDRAGSLQIQFSASLFLFSLSLLISRKLVKILRKKKKEKKTPFLTLILVVVVV